MKKVLGATVGLLIVMGSVAPAGQTTGAGSWDWPAGQPTASSWDWPK